MNSDVDLYWKILEIVGLIAGGLIFLFKLNSSMAKREIEVKEKFKQVETKQSEQDKHMEFSDDRYEKISSQLGALSTQIGQFGVFDLRIKQLEKENTERQEENKTIMRKLDGIFNKMNQLELSVNNKANRP